MSASASKWRLKRNSKAQLAAAHQPGLGNEEEMASKKKVK